MIVFSILVALSCPKTEVINRSAEAFGTKNDVSALNRAQVGCGQYYPDMPCAKTFIKKAPQDYAVICGSKEKR